MENVIKSIYDFSVKEPAEVPTRFMKLMEEVGEWSAAYLEKIGFKVGKTVKTEEELDDHVLEEGCDTLIMVYDVLFKQGYTQEQIEAKVTEKLEAWRKVLEHKGLLNPTPTEIDEDKGNIIQNAMLCKKCGTIISSRSVHDFLVCGCDNEVMVDGGLDYLRYSWGNVGNDGAESLHLYERSDFEIIKSKLLWGTYGKEGDKAFKWVKLIDCETEHLKNIIINVTRLSSIHRAVIIDILIDREEF